MFSLLDTNVEALAMVLENPSEVIYSIPGRTNNRIRSPRLAASGRLEECR
jgi:hypothetical protein